MTRKLSDLNDILFAQLDRLSSGELTAEQIDAEVKRAVAMVSVSDQVIKTADLTFKAAKLVAENGGYVSRLMPMTESLVGVAQGSPPPSPAIENKPQ